MFVETFPNKVGRMDGGQKVVTKTSLQNRNMGNLLEKTFVLLCSGYWIPIVVKSIYCYHPGVLTPGHVPGYLVTPLACKGIQGGPDLQSLANSPKLYACQFEVPSLQTMSTEEIYLHILLFGKPLRKEVPELLSNGLAPKQEAFLAKG